MQLYGAMMLSESGDDRDSMATTIQHHGLTTPPWTWGGMIATRHAPSVAPQVARGSPTIGPVGPKQREPEVQGLQPDEQSASPGLVGAMGRGDLACQPPPE